VSCGMTECLPPVKTPLARLPRGYQLNSTEIMARGVCPDCHHK
jgi:hypothetical protein